MATDTKYLELRGKRWWAVVYVPRRLRSKLGVKLTCSLETDSLTKAQRARWLKVAAFKTQIADAEGAAPAAVNLESRAMQARDLLKATERHGNARTDESETFTPYDEAEAATDALTDLIAQEEGEAAAARFSAIAYGKATPIGLYVDRWLAASEFTTRTRAEHRTAINRLIEWTRETSAPGDLETFARRNASDFRDLELMAHRGLARKTVNKSLSSIRSYWAWLIDSGLAPEPNPLARTSLAKPKRTGRVEGKERSFTDDEMRALLHEIKDKDLQDFMRIAALSGMRIEEIASLTVGRCANEVFEVADAKTPNSAGRLIPIHSALRAIIARRSKGKTTGDFLLLDGRKANRNGERSAPIVKRFTRQRRACGVNELVDGKRRSLVNFHSFRRWFMRKAIEAHGGRDNAGTFPWTLADIVGHATGELPFDLTMRKYPGAATIRRRKAIVESIKLPE